MGEFKYFRAKLNCSSDMSFEDIWVSIFKQFVFTDGEETETVDKELPPDPNSENIREAFQVLGERSIVIVDELDKVKDQEVIRKLS
jgi:hypothetical protein